MKELIDLGLFTKRERVLASSRIIAVNFDKRHDQVIRGIQNIL